MLLVTAADHDRGVLANENFHLEGFTSEEAERFLATETLMVFALGAIAFIFSTAGGILFAKIINVFLSKEKKINPCIGASGVSAVPMSARVVQQFVSDETNGRVNPLMPAMGPNVAGVIGSAVAAGVFLALLR